MIRPSRSEFGYPIWIVRKTDVSQCLCIDYKGMNEATQKGAYTLPRVNDTMDEENDAIFTLTYIRSMGFGSLRTGRGCRQNCVSNSGWSNGVGVHGFWFAQCSNDLSAQDE
jgi:hypothetical protein